MQQFNYPTTILFGEGSLAALAQRLSGKVEKALIVTDATLVKAGLADRVTEALQEAGVGAAVFDGTHPNPIEEDVDKGLEAYKAERTAAAARVGDI